MSDSISHRPDGSVMVYLEGGKSIEYTAKEWAHRKQVMDSIRDVFRVGPTEMFPTGHMPEIPEENRMRVFHAVDPTPSDPAKE